MELGGILKAMFKNSMLMIPKEKIIVYFPQKNKQYLFNSQRYIYFYDMIYMEKYLNINIHKEN